MLKYILITLSLAAIAAPVAAQAEGPQAQAPAPILESPLLPGQTLVDDLGLFQRPDRLTLFPDMEAGASGEVAAIAEGKIWEIRPSMALGNGDRIVSVTLVSVDGSGQWIEQRFMALSESSVREALGVGAFEGTGQVIQAGQVIGTVAPLTWPNAPQLEYRVRIDSQSTDPEAFLASDLESVAATR